MKVYINCPNPHIMIHRSNECTQSQKQGKENQRRVTVNSQNLGRVLTDFMNEKYRFAADSEYNDLWLDISLNTAKHEESLVYIIQAILGCRYKPLERACIEEHPC